MAKERRICEKSKDPIERPEEARKMHALAKPLTNQQRANIRRITATTMERLIVR
jgi:hypothetical protein